MNKGIQRSFAPFLIFALVIVFAARSLSAEGYAQNLSLPSKEGQTTSDQAKTESQKKEEPAWVKQIRELEESSSSVVKTYTLKFASPAELINLAKFYILESTSAGNIVTVRILKRNIRIFEDLLNKLDVEKKSILFRVYTILASREAAVDEKTKIFPRVPEQIEDSELKKVLDELKGLWNFKQYRVDNPSFLTVKDGSGSNYCRLVSSGPWYDLYILHPQIRGDEPGRRIIAAGQIQLVQTANFTTVKLIDTSDVTFKENGYLVVGVGGSGAGNAIILVLSAEIK